MGVASPVVSVPADAQGAPIRVMVVDDSVVVRGLVSRWIAETPGLEAVGSLRTGREAVEQVTRINPDVVVLDIEMPDLDGISALPLLLEKKPSLVVIMASTLTRRNAEISIRALSLGAADYIPKPETNREVTTSAVFRQDLIEKIRQLGSRVARKAERRQARPAVQRPAPIARAAATAVSTPAHGFRLRSFAPVIPKVLLIGSSTGGPQALMKIVAELGALPKSVPILITQHMPATFTTILAEHLARAGHRPGHEPADGERIVGGTIYLAPGGRHMRVERRDGVPVIALDDGPLVNFCKPAVDPLFSSAAQVWGNSALALILTGMGSDGMRGAAEIVAAGGNVIAQDEASSVVWGMPGAAAQAGICAAVLPLDQIAPKILRTFSGDRT